MPWSVARRKAADECRELYERSLEKRRAADPSSRVLSAHSHQIHDGTRPLISNLLQGQYSDRGRSFLWDTSVENGSPAAHRNGRRTGRSYTPGGRVGSAMTQASEGTQTDAPPPRMEASVAAAPAPAPAVDRTPPQPQPRPATAPHVGYRPGSARSQSAGRAREVAGKIGAHPAVAGELTQQFCGFIPRKQQRRGGNAYSPVLEDTVARTVARSHSARPHTPEFTARTQARQDGGAAPVPTSAKLAFLSKSQYEELRRCTLSTSPSGEPKPQPAARPAPVIAAAACPARQRFQHRPKDRSNLIL